MKITKIFKRVLQMIIVLLGISFLTFLLTYLAPGDPATAMYDAVGIVPTEKQLQDAKISMGLDKPFIQQYICWLKDCLHGNLGISFSKKTSVIDLIKSKIFPTLKLTIASMLIMLIFSVPLGILSAIYKNKIIDYIIRFFSFIGISMPGFWIGLMLQYIFAMKLDLLPVISSGTSFQKMILPSVTLAISMTAKYTRQVRTAVLEEINQNYIIGAKSRGISSNIILWKHILPNSILPLITLLGLSFGSLLCGATVVELIFSYSGIGQLIVQAVSYRDYPLIQGIVLWISLIYMIINVLIDISYSLLDPRIKKAR